MLSDLRFSVRALLKARGFALVAILTLAVGVGAATAIFSALRAVVLSPFRYPAADQLVHVWSGDDWPLSPADFLDMRAQSTSFTAFGAYEPNSVNVGRDHAQAVDAILGTSDVLRAFAVSPALGRFFLPSDEAIGAPPVAILSHGLWQQTFGNDPGAIGHRIRIDGQDYTVVGVMPKDFEFVSPWLTTASPQVWLPLSLEDQKTSRDSHFMLGIARMKSGVSVAQANAEIQSIGKRLTALYPNSNSRKPLLVRSLYFEMTKAAGQQVWLLFGAVMLVLLVACGNVASMLLARGTRRDGEFAVRVALGATRAAVMRLALTESLLLAMTGAALGIILAWGGIAALRAFAPVSEARKAAITLNGSTLAFALGATLLTALLAGLPPALAAVRTSLAGVIRTDARGSIGSRSRHHLLRLLIISQVAVAFVLANGAVLFSSGYTRLLDENHAVDSASVVASEIALRGPRYKENADRVRFWDQLVEQVRALPGVTQAGITSKLPLEGGSNTSGLVNDESYDPTIKRLSIERSSVTDGYFAAMGLHLLKGRLLQSEDRIGDVRGAVVNQAMVDAAWPNKNPLGEIIRANQPDHPWYVVRVVGVVDNVNQRSAEGHVRPEMYTTPNGHWGNGIYLIVRSSLPVSQLAPMLRRTITGLDDELPIKEVRTMHQVVGRATQNQRAVAMLINFFMINALGLVAVGLYGTLSYHVQHRTREIGVRMALGAERSAIARLVIGQGARWVALGLGLGSAGSIALSSAIQALVYRMSGLTAPPLLLAIGAVGLATLVACWVPARRAARLDPLEALRT